MANEAVSDVVINYKSVGLDKVGSEIKQTSVALDGLVVAATSSEKATASLENRFKSLERQLGTTSGQQQKFEKAQSDINKAVAQNPALQDRANAALKAAEEKYLGAGHAAEGFSGQSQALMHSIRSVGEQIALGTGPIQALTGQISHLSYVMTAEGGISSAFGQVAAKARSGIAALAEAITPLRAVAGGVAAFGAAGIAAAYQWTEAQDKISQALIGIGRKTGTTGADINKFASDNATATGLSVSEARNAAIAFTKTGEIAVGQLKGLGEAVHGFSILTGQDAAESAKTLAKALGGDLVAGAKQLDQVYGALDGRTLQLIATLQATGERQAAQQIILKALEEQNRKAAESVGILTKAYNLLGNEVAATWAQLGKALTFNLPGDRRSPLEVASDKNKSQMAADTQGGDAAVKSLLPQIDAYQKLIALQEDLNKARESSGAQGLGGFNEAAAVAAANAAKSTKEALQDSIAYGQSVARIAAEYSNLSTAAALAHQASVDQLPVIQAITGAQKMAAQYAVDYWTAMDKSGKSADALQAAVDKLAASQAAALAAAQQTTKAMEDQNELAKVAGTSAEKRVAAEQAYKKVIEDIGDTEKGRAAANERSSAVEESYRIKERQADEQKQRAADEWARKWKEANDAYRQAVFSSQAIADNTDIIAENTARAAKTAADFARAMQLGSFAPDVMPTGQLGFVADPRTSVSYKGGGTGKNLSVGYGTVGNLLLAQGQATIDPITGRLVGKTQETAADKLTSSLDDLKTSTDRLNDTNQELLSPFYSQDPRTSHIGFRSQGMALGGYVDVPGAYSTNDNIIAQIPVASGERIYVDPMASRRGGTDSGKPVIINSTTNFYGPVDRDEVGRTVYQTMQQAGRSIAAAQR